MPMLNTLQEILVRQLELLSRSDRHDSVFEIFLEMVVRAVYSPMPFSRTVPRSNHELSMLLNRFSVMAVAIHLDPTLPNIRFRINQD
ncbi:hypothetical protein EDD16DRAFT_1581270, partial [Pisolithus croceorrhizus]